MLHRPGGQARLPVRDDPARSYTELEFDAGYDKQVATTWSLAIAALGRDSPAAGLLRLTACGAAEDIPLALLLQPGTDLAESVAGESVAAVIPLLAPLLDDELARDNAVAGLRRYSLVSAPRDGRVSVHRLVQAIIGLSNVAHWTGMAGDPAAARDQYGGLLPIYARILGAEHPDLRLVRANLALWTRRAGAA